MNLTQSEKTLAQLTARRIVELIESGEFTDEDSETEGEE